MKGSVASTIPQNAQRQGPPVSNLQMQKVQRKLDRMNDQYKDLKSQMEIIMEMQTQSNVLIERNIILTQMVM